MSQTEKPKFQNEVNKLFDLLREYDDYDMSYKNVKSEITDVDNDLAQITIDGEVVVKYRYGGANVWPIEVNEGLLLQALEVVNNIHH